MAFLSFQRTQAYSDPVTFWKQCTLDSPRAASAHFSLGVIDMRLNRDPVAASASYGNAIALNPQNYRYHNNLGRAYEMQGRFADAATEYRTAMRMNPSDPMPPFNLGNTYFRVKNYAEAERYWKMAYSLDTNFTEAMRRIHSLSSAAGHSTPAGGEPDAKEH